MRNWLKIFIVLILISNIALVGCQESNANFPTETKEIANTPNIETNLPKLEGNATILMTVKGSPITIEVDGNNAPITAGNFVYLVDRGFYNGLVFHRVVKQPQPFVAQGGDPKGTGTGGFIDPDTQKTRYIPLEIRPQYKEGEEAPDIIYSKTTKKTPQLKHTRGAIAMARSQMPDSASSQFYFSLADHSFLDGNYAVFGYVTNGMDVVDKIDQGDRIDSAKVINGIQNLKK